MALIIKPSFKREVHSLYKKYVKRFLSEWNEEGRYEPCVLIGDEKKGDGKYNDLITDDQIEFIRLYLAHMMIDGDTKHDLEIIRHFLSMQGAKKDDKRMQIRFILGSTPEVYVYVDSLNEIDLADTYGITGFKTMHVYNANKKRWTLKTIRKFIKDVKDDFRFDGYEPKIDFKYKSYLLAINCKMK